MSSSTSTRLGRDVRPHIPPRSEIPSIVELDGRDAAVWEHAVQRLHVRNNDSHTLYAYGIARALLSRIPEANPDIVRPAILLHDTGWSTVPDELILEAIAPGGGRPDLVLQHEVEGARIAREVLSALDTPGPIIDAVTAIVDGHDTTRHARSIEDAVVKDADKLWRITPHGNAIVCGWFGLDPDESLRITAARVHDALLTEPARAMAAALTAIASIDLAPQLQALEVSC
jgi:HD superfamily phosphodiesterase